MTQTASPEAVVHAYVAALNAGDLEAIVALYADDASVEDPVGSAPHRGRQAIRAFYARSVAVPLEVALEGPVRVAGRECAFPFSVSLVYESQRMTFRPIDTFRFDEAGRIVQMRAYFGPANISRA
ncbi:MAG: steroid delta-isomerase [Burkholderiaceae bacterium]|jgi:steroid delta-isomerase|nr:MAG: steroid delta-isomerase [Burkholderiaceae bacterium]